MGQLFDDDESWPLGPPPDATDEALAFERYVTEGLELLEGWLRDAE